MSLKYGFDLDRSRVDVGDEIAALQLAREARRPALGLKV